MKSQVANPYTLINNLGCDVSIEITEFDANCAITAGPTQVTIPASSSINWTLSGGTVDLAVLVIFVATPACTVTQNNVVETSTIINCAGNITTSGISGPACSCGISSIIVSANDVTIN